MSERFRKVLLVAAATLLATWHAYVGCMLNVLLSLEIITVNVAQSRKYMAMQSLECMKLKLHPTA